MPDERKGEVPVAEHVAAGRVDAFWSFSTKLWDVAAGALLIREAGGLISRPDGTPYALQDGQFLAGPTPRGRFDGLEPRKNITRQRRAFLDDPEVRDWVRAQGREDGDLEALLAATPAYGRSAARDAAGHPPRVLEAISEGVEFTSLEHSAAADSFAALRPRLGKRDRAVALARAFGYAGRPYDFDFDFLTDSALVCSELVYKAYEPGAATAGLRFELESIAGRRLATPNGMARAFDADAAAGRAQLDLAVFLDGSEKLGRAVEGTAEEFRSSWKRPKWHVIVAR